MVAVREFGVWKRIRLGTGLVTAEDFHRDLRSKGFPVARRALELLGQVSVTAGETEVDVVAVSVTDLGFSCPTRYGEICAIARSRGLELCSPEVGPQLRLHSPYRNYGEHWVIAIRK